MMKPTPPAVRFIEHDLERDLLAFVRTVLSSAEVRVRIRHREEGWRWVCDVHGKNTRPTCPHVQAVMAALARMAATANTNPRGTHHDHTV